MLEGLDVVILHHHDLFSKSFCKAGRIWDRFHFAGFVNLANPTVIVERAFMHSVEMPLEVDDEISPRVTSGQAYRSKRGLSTGVGETDLFSGRHRRTN